MLSAVVLYAYKILIDDVILSMINSSRTDTKYICPNGKEAKNEMKVGCMSFFPNQHFSVMDMDKFDRIDRLSSQNGLISPFLRRFCFLCKTKILCIVRGTISDMLEYFQL